MVKKENILKATPLEKFEGEHFEDLTQSIPQNMRQVVLEVTENCNLRCDYCIYQNSFSGFRDFSPRSMSEETAIKAIDYILKNSYRDEIYVGFYGGEPLLKFDLIKKCVSYALENRGEKKVTFSMTTNGVLMTEEKAEYFASIPEFSLMFSIDGDEKTHNEHRKLENGRGSFELSLKGFQNALKAYGDRRKMISVSTVVSPPYTKEKFEDMAAWCHGAPGILLARSKMYNLVKDSSDYITVQCDIERALFATKMYGFTDNDCLCHGNLGNTEILLEYSKECNDEEVRHMMLSARTQIAMDIINENYDCARSYLHGYKIPGFMTGISGMGWNILYRNKKWM